ncbi:MAG: hypothetical protein U9R50_01755 [Campylobacterota bacterium]|nr:hypothetical protein [Campylobacterota bacterium]
MKSNYRLAISYFALFTLLLILSGLWIFILKSGLTFQGIEEYYAPKSYKGILEIAQPHLLAIGIFIMVNSHFFLFSKKEKKKAILLSNSLYISALILILSPLLINEESYFFVFIKLLSTLMFILLVLHVSIKLSFLTLKK